MTGMDAPARTTLPNPVVVVGAGLIGTSVAMALDRRHVEVQLEDVDPLHAAVARSRLGTGTRPPDAESRDEMAPALVVVATPPDHLGEVIAEALRRHTGAFVTDVGSVKMKPLDDLRAAGLADETGLARYVGSHPMAGSERSGPLAAAADLFDGRTWAVTPHEDSSSDAVAAVESLVAACDARVVRMTPQEHDLAVARTSHLPHLMAALTAGRLQDAPESHLALSGQGVRDVTRIAAGDPRLWRQIVVANAGALRQLLFDASRDLDALITALDAGDLSVVESVLAAGATGAAAIPGKHGGPMVALAAVTVAIPDRPGALAELFHEIGALGVNIEDIRIDHDPGRAFGVVEIDVTEGRGDDLAAALRERGWAAHR